MRNAPLALTWYGLSRQRQPQCARWRGCDGMACGTGARRPSTAAGVPAPTQ
jgi:hypothetical protein